MTTTERLRVLFERVLTWPPDQQERAVEALATIEARQGETYEPDDDEWASIQEGLAEIDRGEAATEVELGAVWKRFGA